LGGIGEGFGGFEGFEEAIAPVKAWAGQEAIGGWVYIYAFSNILEDFGVSTT